jgi:hypothetical protein
MQYASGKQFGYRDRVVAHYGECKPRRQSKLSWHKEHIAVTLGGQDCIKNPNSIEHKILSRYHGAMIIVERNRSVIEKLCKGFAGKSYSRVKYLDLWNNHPGRMLYCYKHYNRPWLIYIFHGSMLDYLKWAVNNKVKHDLFVLDYYGNFYSNYKNDIMFIKKNKLCKKNADLFITVPDARRTISLECVKFFMRRNPCGGYIGGVRLALANLFKSKLKHCVSWDYKADVYNLKCLTMHIVWVKLI